MTALERARHYAALFASLTANGENWRLCAPVDGRPHRTRDEMRLGEHRVVRREGVSGWDVVPA